MPDQMLTVKEAAGYLRTSLKTVYLLIRAGRLPAVNVARPGSPRPQWRLSRSVLDSLGEQGRREAACPDGLTEDQKKRISAYEDGLPEEVREGIHRNSPIVAWRCKACWHVTYVPEFTTGGKTPPTYCSECGTKATPGNLALPDNFIYEGRYEASQPWEDARPARRRR